MPPQSGGICGRLTEDLPLGYLLGGFRRDGCQEKVNAMANYSYAIIDALTVPLEIQILKPCTTSKIPCLEYVTTVTRFG